MLAHDFAGASLRVVDYNVSAPPCVDDLAKLSAPLSSMLTAELDAAQRCLRLQTAEILLAALGRAISRTIGDGVAAVDLAGRDRSVPLTCTPTRETSATEMLGIVHRTLAGVAIPGRFTARTPSDILLSDVGTVPRGPTKDANYALQLWAYRNDGVLQLDWWYDVRRMERSTVEELSEQLPLALIELTSEAIPPIEPESAMAGRPRIRHGRSTVRVGGRRGLGP
jgi:hypothetical protein